MTSSLSWSWLPPCCSPNAGPLPASPRWAPKSNREPFGAIKLQLIGEKEARGCLILPSFDPNDWNNLPCWTISTVRQQHWDQSGLTANRTRRRRSWCCHSRFPGKVFQCPSATSPNQWADELHRQASTLRPDLRSSLAAAEVGEKTAELSASLIWRWKGCHMTEKWRKESITLKCHFKGEELAVARYTFSKIGTKNNIRIPM